MTKVKDKDILDRSDAWVDDKFIVTHDNSWMKDSDVTNFPYDTWRDGKKEKRFNDVHKV